MFVFAQPFSLGGVGGGPRILRSVFDDAPTQVFSICTGSSRPLPSWHGSEIGIPMRPSLGRIERTRFSPVGGLIERFYAPVFKTSLVRILERLKPAGLHLVPHSWGDFASVHSACQSLNIPVHISIHDDFRYTAANHWFLPSLERKLAKLWNASASRMVISQEMGEELCKRYGSQHFAIHTDGAVPQRGHLMTENDSRAEIYFMGMYHHAYYENFNTLFGAMERLNSSLNFPSHFTFKGRTHGFTPMKSQNSPIISILPFADHDTVAKELRLARFLYLPLPFGSSHQAFTKFSLSTKMVTYLASGVPILYHGPGDSAAAGYLRRNDAGILLESNTIEEVAAEMAAALANPARLHAVGENALLAIQCDFDPETLKRRFWETVGFPEIMG